LRGVGEMSMICEECGSDKIGYDAMSKNNVDKVKELITNHEISASELVNKYVDLVYTNS
jgi:acyl CoA:acetate/3-ketoacid CoA transferase alpha subunit